MLLRFIYLALIFICSTLCAAKPASLSYRDTKIKIKEILKAHVTYDSLSPELIKRSFDNFLEELDPSKTYFLEEEVAFWTDPSQALLEKTIQNIQRENFSTFEKLHSLFPKMVERRRVLEEKLAKTTLKKGVKSSDFKELTWLKTEDELFDRILSIHSMQMESGERLDPELVLRFQERLAKRRVNREERLYSREEKTLTRQVALSLILKSIGRALDSETRYFTPQEANQFMIQVQQRLFGIGAQLKDDLNGLTIVMLLDGGPAKEGGQIRIGDRIIAVDNEPIVGMEMIDAVELIRGTQGSKVTLTIARQSQNEDQLIKVSLKRGEVIFKEARLSKRIEPYADGVIGIIGLHSFYEDPKASATSDLKEAIGHIRQEHNLKGIVLDLRGNGGGLLTEATSVSGLFIKKGIVVSVKDNKGRIQHLRNVEKEPFWDGPLVIVTDRTSASAAEIVAQTLQDYGRAIVVGDETTYGKGTFQTFTLDSRSRGKVNPKGEYKVTRGCYYTVSGKSPQLVGVLPDIVVPGIYDQLDIGERFSKYPLENQSIAPNFKDDLADVPPAHRARVAALYQFDLQQIMEKYHDHLPQLLANSQARIQQNPHYQSFIELLSDEDNLSETFLSYQVCDLQLAEASNILKDLIYLMQADSLDQAS